MLTFLTTSTPQAIHFPAGEPHLPATEPGTLAGDQVALLTGADADELITLAMWASAVHADDGHPHALIPYLPGARADRAPRLEATVYADLLNAARFASITCLDPHSPVIVDLIDRLTVVTAADMIAASLTDTDLTGFVGIIAPDEGAHQRAAAVATALDLPVYQARKHRDFDTGKLTGFSCEYVPRPGTCSSSTTSATAVARSWASPESSRTPTNACTCGSPTACSPGTPPNSSTTTPRCTPPTPTPAAPPSPPPSTRPPQPCSTGHP